jgi:signal transduction histidine kinase
LAFGNTERSASLELVNFVQKAADLVEREGGNRFPQLRELGGEWFRGEDYVFLWGLDGVRYVYPPDTTGEGKKTLHLKDIHGKPIGEWIVAKARR